MALKACLKQTSLSEKDAEEMRGIQVQSQTDCKAQLSTGLAGGFSKCGSESRLPGRAETCIGEFFEPHGTLG